MIPQEIMSKYSQEWDSIIEGAYLAGFEPSVDGLTGYIRIGLVMARRNPAIIPLLQSYGGVSAIQNPIVK